MLAKLVVEIVIKVTNKIPVLLSMLALIAGCVQPVKETASYSNQAEESPEERFFYNTLTAEIAGHRGNLTESVRYYQKVLPVTDELPIIRRATRIMLFAKDYDAADKAIQRWLTLAPESIEAHQLAATVGLQRGDIPLATANLQWMLQHADDLAQGFKLISALLDRLDDKALAASVMAGVLASYPDSLDAQIVYARLAYNAGLYEKSKVVAGKAVKEMPENIQAQIILARSNMELGQADRALKALQTIVEKNAKNKELRLNYARMLVTANRYERAIEQFNILLEANPDNVELLYSTALLSMQIRQFDRAEKYFHQLLARGSHQQEVWFYLGRLHENRKDYSRALNWFAKVNTPSLYMDSQMSAARVQGKLGQIGKARERYDLLRESNPSQKVSLWLSESEMLREIDDDQAAFDLLDSAVEQLPEDIDLRYSRALAAERIGRIDLLESDLKIVLQQEPEHAHALNALGYTLADQTNRYEEALQYILRAFKIEPNDPAIIDSMGWIQYRLGNLDVALKYLRKANEGMKDGEVAAHLGEVLWVAGQREAATKVWKEAQQEYPDSKILIRAIKRFNP